MSKASSTEGAASETIPAIAPGAAEIARFLEIGSSLA